MSKTIRHFSINYDPINESNTFTNGDVLSGRVSVEVTKEVKIDQLYVKCKGDANVHWTESNSFNESDDSYSAHERYFKLKHVFIWDNSKRGNDGATLVTNGETYNNLVAPGHHEFPFRFRLPLGNAPPSFKGQHGSIKYVLEARLCRSWKMNQTAVREFSFLSNFPQNGTQLMEPLCGTIDKKMKLFTSGSVSVKASIDKMGYTKGEIIKVETQIENASSRALKPKFKFEQRQKFTAQSHHNYATSVIFKAIEDPIPSRAKKTVTSRLKIPTNLDITIMNCDIITVGYTLKVYLDVPYAKDPEIVFPVVILPANQYFPPLQNQADSQLYHNTHGTNRRRSLPQSSIASSHYGAAAAAAAGFGSAPDLYPNVYPPQLLTEPEEPPPSYTDIYPDSYPQASFLSALSPLPYPAVDCPPPYSSTAMQSSDTGYWEPPANPDSYASNNQSGHPVNH